MDRKSEKVYQPPASRFVSKQMSIQLKRSNVMLSGNLARRWKRNAYMDLLGKTEGKKSLGKPGHK